MYPQQDWHFWSTDLTEKDRLDTEGIWYPEASFWAPKKEVSGVIPVYRCWNPSWLNHFWSTSQFELARKAGFVDEGPAYYVYPPGPQPSGTMPLLRYVWTRGTATNIHHFWCLDPSKEALGEWSNESYIGFAYASRPPDAVPSEEVHRFRNGPGNWTCQLLDGPYLKFATNIDQQWQQQAQAACMQYLNFTKRATRYAGSLRANLIKR
jgi:hypothetical protein